MKKILTVAMLVFAVAAVAETNKVCSISCCEDGIIEKGCSIEQHNSDDINRLNIHSCGYYVMVMAGKKEAIALENGSNDACYMLLTLANGETFCAGDQLTITGMRNIKAQRKSSLHFAYSNGACVDDANVWNNLGMLQDMTFGGNTGAKGNRASTEPLEEYSMFPSTFTFVVPAEAHGSTSVKLTRNESECLLYLTEITLSRDTLTGVSTHIVAEPEYAPMYNLSGQRIAAKTGGVIIRNGKKILMKRDYL